MIKSKIPRMKEDIILLQETKCDNDNMGRITQKIWHGTEVRCMEVEGTFAGITTLGDPNLIEMQDFSSNARYLTLKFRCIGIEEDGYITNVYGPNMPNLRRNFLD